MNAPEINFKQSYNKYHGAKQTAQPIMYIDYSVAPRWFEPELFIDWSAKPDFGKPEMYIDFNAKPDFGGQENYNYDFQSPVSRYQSDEIIERTTTAGINYYDGFDGYQLEQDYLIDGILAVNDFAVMVAPPKSYKTFSAIHLAACVATGKSFGNHEIDKQGLVIYVAAESGTGAKKRLKSWCVENAGEFDDVESLVRRNFKIIPRPLRPTQKETRVAIINAITEIEEKEKTHVSLIVFDTLARCYEGDENSSSDMGAFVSAIDEIKQCKNCASLIVHHCGKGGEIRGSSALSGAYDARFDIERIDDEEKGERYLKFNVTEIKEGEIPSPIFFKLNSNVLYYNKKGARIDALSVSSDYYDIDGFKLKVGINRILDIYPRIDGKEKGVSIKKEQLIARHPNELPRDMSNVSSDPYQCVEDKGSVRKTKAQDNLLSYIDTALHINKLEKNQVLPIDLLRKYFKDLNKETKNLDRDLSNLHKKGHIIYGKDKSIFLNHKRVPSPIMSC